MQSLKKKLHLACEDLITQKIDTVQTALRLAQDSANNETKSSAGDKHETSRAMAHLETEKLVPQLKDALKLKESLSKVNIDAAFNSVAFGSLVQTDKGIFYIAIGLGKMQIERITVFVISPLSPIGQLLWHKKEKERISFRGTEHLIEAIY